MAESPRTPCPTPLRVVGFGDDAGPSGGADPPAHRRARRSSVPDSPSALGRLLARESSLPSLPSLTVSTKGCRAPSVGLRTPASARSAAGGGTSPNATPQRRFAAYRSVSAVDLSSAAAEALLSRSSDPISIPMTARWRPPSDIALAEAAMLDELADASVESHRCGGPAPPVTPAAFAAPPASPAVGSLRAMKAAIEGQAAARLLDQLVAAEADRAVLRSDCAALRAAAARCGDGGFFFDEDVASAGGGGPPPRPPASDDDEEDESSGAPTPRRGPLKGAAAAAGPLGSVGAELGGSAGLGGLGSPVHAVAF